MLLFHSLPPTTAKSLFVVTFSTPYRKTGGLPHAMHAGALATTRECPLPWPSNVPALTLKRRNSAIPTGKISPVDLSLVSCVCFFVGSLASKLGYSGTEKGPRHILSIEWVEPSNNGVLSTQVKKITPNTLSVFDPTTVDKADNESAHDPAGFGFFLHLMS